MCQKGGNKTNHTKLKVDFNLLLSGTWVLEKKGNQRIHYFEKKAGDGKIVIYNALDVPSPFDSKLLDYLMLKSQENDWSQEIVIPTISTVIRDLGLRKEKRVAERIKHSLKILKNTHIEFHNCFIDNGVLKHFKEGTWELVSIGILTKYGFEKVKGRGNPLAIKVVFDDDFLALCKHSLGYKLIPYTPINGLRDTAYALYKWAWRWFNSGEGYGERWIGNAKKLVEWYKNELNSTANYKYPSKVLERIRSAIKQLNENPQVPFYLQLKEENGNYKIEIHLKNQCTLKREIPFDQLPGFLKRTVIRLIERKKHVREPFALARSMSHKELENLLKGIAVVPVPKSTWDFIVNDIIAKAHNEAEKKEFEETVLGFEEKEDEILVALESSKLGKKNLITILLDGFIPNWREFIQSATGFINEAKVLSRSRQ
jgi:hypothetical protein